MTEMSGTPEERALLAVMLADRTACSPIPSDDDDDEDGGDRKSKDQVANWRLDREAEKERLQRERREAKEAERRRKKEAREREQSELTAAAEQLAGDGCSTVTLSRARSVLRLGIPP
jgi:hypothetical protein